VRLRDGLPFYGWDVLTGKLCETASRSEGDRYATDSQELQFENIDDGDAIHL
jgi:hypothetical protein